MKYLLLVVFVGVIWWVWKKRHAAPQETTKREAPPESMVSCAHCGVHLPASEALLEAGRSYCCAAHRQAATR